MEIYGKVFTLEGNPMNVKISIILNIQHDDNYKDLYGFLTGDILVIEKDHVPFDFDSYSNLNVNVIVRRTWYFPSKGVDKISWAFPPSLLD